MERKKPRLYGEALYVTALFTLSFSIALMAAADLGGVRHRGTGLYPQPQADLSHLRPMRIPVAGAGIRHVLHPHGQGAAGVLRFLPDLPALRRGAGRVAGPGAPAESRHHAPGQHGDGLRIVYFLMGMVGTSFSVNLFFQTYFYPQVPDFFVKGVSRRFGIDRIVFKRSFDASLLVISTAMTLLLLGRFVGIGVGTLIMTFCNGILIGWFGRQMHKYFDIVPKWPKIAKAFELS